MVSKGRFIKSKPITLVTQKEDIIAKYPAFLVSGDYKSIKIIGELQPTARSLTYKFELKYGLDWTPRVRIISPVLLKNSLNEKIPHMYSQKLLCLYRLKYEEFTKSCLLSETIIPWTSMWLYYYEMWHVTGKWLGGGEHPPSGKKKKKGKR